jgi:hypothetical protein
VVNYCRSAIGAETVPIAERHMPPVILPDDRHFL